MMARGLTASRSQAASWINLGKVTVNGRVVTKAGTPVAADDDVVLTAAEQYVSRAGLKLASVADVFNLNFEHKIVLDVGSSTGGFTDYALRRGAKKVYAVDVGTEQMHPSLRTDPRVELHEKTDIRDFKTVGELPDIIVIDVSFISLREILPHITAHLCSGSTRIVAMVKPQFEAGRQQVNKGVIKNDTIRRRVLSDFEQWVRSYCIIHDKRDSDVTGARGNRERFYVLFALQR